MIETVANFYNKKPLYDCIELSSTSLFISVCEFHILETLLGSLNGDVYVIGAEEYTQATEKTEETYHHNNDVE